MATESVPSLAKAQALRTSRLGQLNDHLEGLGLSGIYAVLRADTHYIITLSQHYPRDSSLFVQANIASEVKSTWKEGIRDGALTHFLIQSLILGRKGKNEEESSHMLDLANAILFGDQGLYAHKDPFEPRRLQVLNSHFRTALEERDRHSAALYAAVCAGLEYNRARFDTDYELGAAQYKLQNYMRKARSLGKLPEITWEELIESCNRKDSITLDEAVRLVECEYTVMLEHTYSSSTITPQTTNHLTNLRNALDAWRVQGRFEPIRICLYNRLQTMYKRTDADSEELNKLQKVWEMAVIATDDTITD